MKIRKTIVTFIAVLMGTGVLVLPAVTGDAQEAYPSRPVRMMLGRPIVTSLKNGR